MKLVLEESFLNRLDRQLNFIALVSPARARRFGAALMKAVRQIPSNPLLYRRSVYFDDPNIRDMVFRGYTVVFRMKEVTIEVFGLIHMQLKPTDD